MKKNPLSILFRLQKNSLNAKVYQTVREQGFAPELRREIFI